MFRLALLLLLAFASSLSAADGVRAEFLDKDLPSEKWPAELPAVSETYDEAAFGFTRVP